MKKIILNILILFIVLHANAQKFELIKDDQGQVMQIEFFDTIRQTKIKTVDLIESNPFMQNYREYKDTTLATSRCFIIKGDLYLDDVIPPDKREMYEPKRAAEINKFKIEEVLLFNPKLITTNNRNYVVVVYNQGIYFGTSFSKGLCGVNSKIKIYDNLGQISDEFEFGSTIGSFVISEDGRYLTFSYEEGDADWMLVKAGMAIYDVFLKKEIFREKFDYGYRMPRTYCIQNLQITATSTGRNNLYYVVYNVTNRTLYEINIDSGLNMGQLEITKSGFIFDNKQNKKEKIEFLFEKDFKKTKVGQL